MVELEPETFVASDGQSLVMFRYPPHGTAHRPALGTVVFVHGIRSHHGWYKNACQRISQAGYSVVFPDRRGAGANTEHVRGDCPSFRRLLDDVIEVCEAEKRRTPGPVYVAGISWGGKLAISLPYRKPGVVDGIVLIAPGIVPKVGMSLGQKVHILLSRLFRPTRLFPIPLNSAELFTANELMQSFVEVDQLGLRQATARFLVNSVQLDWYVRRAIKAVQCPVLLLSAGRDRIADAVATKKVLKRISTLQEIVYAKASHTLEFEDRSEYLVDLIRWLKQKTGG